jgi:hypothetical protein
MKQIKTRIFNSIFTNIYKGWAKGLISKKQANALAGRAFKQMERFNVGLDNLSIDNNILADLGITKTKELSFTTIIEIAEFLEASSATERWDMLDLSFDTEPV